MKFEKLKNLKTQKVLLKNIKITHFFFEKSALLIPHETLSFAAAFLCSSDQALPPNKWELFVPVDTHPKHSIPLKFI